MLGTLALASCLHSRFLGVAQQRVSAVSDLLQARHLRDVHTWLGALARNAKILAPVPAAPEQPELPPASIRSFRLKLASRVKKQLAKHLRRTAAKPRPVSKALAKRMQRLLVFTLCSGDVMPALRSVSARLLLLPGVVQCEHKACRHKRAACPGNQVVELRGGAGASTSAAASSSAAQGSAARRFEARIVHYKVRACMCQGWRPSHMLRGDQPASYC